MKPLVSIIIPVFNVEEYLDECIASVIRQTYTNIEVILVNDGSTDASRAICLKYAAEDSRLVLINQENMGVSAARNAGLLKASGCFVTFVDSDDSIDDDYIEQLVNGITEEIDLVCCNIPREIKISSGIISTPCEMAKLFSEFGYTWGKLIRKRCITTGFQSHVSFAEDFIFYVGLIKNLRSALVIDYHGYHYRIRVGSLTGKDQQERHTLEEFSRKNTFVQFFRDDTADIHFYETKTRQIIYDHCYYIFCLLLLLVYRLSTDNVIVEKKFLSMITISMRKTYGNFVLITGIKEKRWKRLIFGTTLLLIPHTGAMIADRILKYDL